MQKESKLSRSLIAGAKRFLNSIGVSEVGECKIAGVMVDFPYSEVRYASWNDYLPDGVWENYEAMGKLFNPKDIPQNWIPFIKEVDFARKKNGSNGPVNLIHGLVFLLEEDQLATNLGLPKIDRLENGELDLQDSNFIKNIIDKVLNNQQLRKNYLRLMASLIPDVSNGFLNTDQIHRILLTNNIKNGIVLDLGCGIGKNSKELSQKLGTFTYGLDRQFHQQWYQRYWNDNEHNGLSFMRGDFRQIPVKNGCADAAVFGYVAQHVTQASLETGLGEALRVLKNGGWLFVGPQSRAKTFGWRFFRKENGKNGETEFKEYSYEKIVRD